MVVTIKDSSFLKDLVLVRNIPYDKAYELLKTSNHNVQPFKPELIKKAL
jgi:hypothetical protein